MTRAHFGQEAGEAFAALSAGGGVIAISRGPEGADPLALFDRALRSAGERPENVSEIAVDHGPGRFSRVRARVAAASGLSASLGAGLAAVGPMPPDEVAKLPARRFKRTAEVAPLYGAEPNITISRKEIYG